MCKRCWVHVEEVVTEVALAVIGDMMVGPAEYDHEFDELCDYLEGLWTVWVHESREE